MFIKFNKFGVAEVAPRIKKIKSGNTLIGYNNNANRQMLIKDGYIQYTGSAPLNCLKYINNTIVEDYLLNKNLLLSKIKIRHAFRHFGIEYILDKLINTNDTFCKDWNDSIQIPIMNDSFYSSFKSIGLTDQTLNKIIKHILLEN